METRIIDKIYTKEITFKQTMLQFAGHADWNVPICAVDQSLKNITEHHGKSERFQI